MEDCTLTYAGQPVTDPATQCARTYRGGDVTVINQGDISASGTNHRGQGTGIGIAAKSDGGDVVIRSSGNISASAVGIRAETSTEGTITIEVTGTLDAPIPLEVIGGNADNRIVTPPIRQARSAVERAAAGVAKAPERAAGRQPRGLISVIDEHAVRLGVAGERQFAQLDLLHSGGSGRGAAGGWRVAGGIDPLSRWSKSSSRSGAPSAEGRGCTATGAATAFRGEPRSTKPESDSRSRCPRTGSVNPVRPRHRRPGRTPGSDGGSRCCTARRSGRRRRAGSGARLDPAAARAPAR